MPRAFTTSVLLYRQAPNVVEGHTEMTGVGEQMTMRRLLAAAIGFGVAPLMIIACGSDAGESPSKPGAPVPHGDHSDSPRPGSQRGFPPGPPGSQNGHWDDNGKPVNGGPTGADGSTGNDVTQDYCAHHEDPGCPAGSYVGPNAIPNPNGSNNYVPCQGTICTNPNHGAGDDLDSGGDDSEGRPAGESPTGGR